VWGLCGLVLFFFLVPSILAIVKGRQAGREIRANPLLLGARRARIGVVCGWIGLGFALLVAIYIVPRTSGTGFVGTEHASWGEA
jgi:hypothetical protein